MRPSIRVILPVICCLWALYVRADDAPVQAELLRTTWDKGWQNNHIRLTLENKSAHPIWFILPFDGIRKLPAKGVFSYKNWKPSEFDPNGFDCQQMKAKEGWALEVNIQNEDFASAFHIPAKKRIVIEDYSLSTHHEQDLKKFEVIEARDLKVNGKTPLDKWLPYETMSGVEKPADPTISTANLDWDREKGRPRDDYPKEKVDEVVAEDVHHWEITVKQNKKPQTP